MTVVIRRRNNYTFDTRDSARYRVEFENNTDNGKQIQLRIRGRLDECSITLSESEARALGEILTELADGTRNSGMAIFGS